MKSPKKKSDDRLVVLTVEPFDMDLVFFYSDSIQNINNVITEERKKWVNKKLGYDLFETLDGADMEGCVYSNENSSRPVLVFIKKGKLEKLTIVHETHHVVEFMSDYFCFKDEVEFKAYLQEMLVRKLWDLVM